MGASSSKTPGKITLYYDERSSPCRAVLLTAAALDIKLELKRLDLLANETLNPEFQKINPQHCLPTLKDGDFVLWESRAIIQYLMNQYAKDNSLYPKDPRKRALVDARLNFDLGCFYPALSKYFEMLITTKVKDEELLKKIDDAFTFLNTFLEGKEWVAGETMSIADISLVASVSPAKLFEEINFGKYPNVSKWLEKCKIGLKGYEEANQKGIDSLEASYKQIMA